MRGFSRTFVCFPAFNPVYPSTQAQYHEGFRFFLVNINVKRITRADRAYFLESPGFGVSRFVRCFPVNVELPGNDGTQNRP